MSITGGTPSPYLVAIVVVIAAAVPTKASDVLADEPDDVTTLTFACSLSSACCHVRVVIVTSLSAP